MKNKNYAMAEILLKAGARTDGYELFNETDYGIFNIEKFGECFLPLCLSLSYISVPVQADFGLRF